MCFSLDLVHELFWKVYEFFMILEENCYNDPEKVDNKIANTWLVEFDKSYQFIVFEIGQFIAAPIFNGIGKFHVR